MINNLIDVALAVYMLGGVMALAVAAVAMVAALLRARATRKKALSYLRRAKDGNVYVIDPQTGTLHRLDDQIVKRLLGDQPQATPRQQKKIRRQVRQALGAH
jgi:hypothetical protein